MARRKAASTAVTIIPAADNALDWLYLNPAGAPSEPGFTFGVLRQLYKGRVNSAAEFCRKKLQPITPPGDADAVPWAVTAERVEVLLPAGADDRYLDPRILTEEVDARAVEGEQALLTYLTFSFPHASRLHESWEAGRTFAFEYFVRGRRLPVILIQHAPGRAGSPNDVHCHLLIAPRRFDGLGPRGFVPDLCCDRGQKIVLDEWLAYKSAQAL